MFHVPRRAAALALFALPLAPASLLAHTDGAPTSPKPTTTHRVPARAGVVRGKVTDKENGQPVVAAQVTIVGTSLGALTNNDGIYTINGVPAGQVTVRVARIGY